MPHVSVVVHQEINYFKSSPLIQHEWDEKLKKKNKKPKTKKEEYKVVNPA